jgi:hypothetical protein
MNWMRTIDWETGVRVMSIPVLCALGGAVIGMTAAFIGALPPSTPLHDLPLAFEDSWYNLHAEFGTWIGGLIGLASSVFALPVHRKVNVFRCIVLTTLGVELLVWMIARRQITPPRLTGWSSLAALVAFTVALFYAVVVLELRLRKARTA